MTNKQLLEKMQEDMELRRIFKVHKVQLLSQRRKNNRIFRKTNKTSKYKRIKRFFIKILERRKEIEYEKYKLL